MWSVGKEYQEIVLKQLVKGKSLLETLSVCIFPQENVGLDWKRLKY